jgi:hypothetical protein
MQSISRRALLSSTTGAFALSAQDVKPTRAPEHRRLLAGSHSPDSIQRALLPQSQWRHFPPASDRSAWGALPSDTLASLAAAGEKALNQPWPSLPASVFLEYKRNGNRSRYEAIANERRTRLYTLVLAECADAEGRFLDEILNGLWLLCEETYWGRPAHLNLQKAGPGLPDAEEPTVDLFAAETGSLLAWSRFLLADALDSVSPLIRPRIVHEIKRRILDPCSARNDFWWMGLDPKQARALNNWTPWIDSNWLTCSLLTEPETTRPASVHKILTSLDRFLDSYHPDGGCDEGPGYWGHAGGSLFECLDLLHSASAGNLDFFPIPLVSEIGKYIYRAHVADDWYVNFADASARISVNGGLIYRYGRAISDSSLMAHGAYAASRESTGRRSTDSIARILANLFHNAGLASTGKRPPLVQHAWLPGTQYFAARAKQGDTSGFFLAAQGGHNNESHNHNDVGNFIVFCDGLPVLIDVGVETYTAKTFSPRRYEIWTMQSAYHNLPTVNGAMQGAGRQFEARDCTAAASATESSLSLDLAAAYPPDAAIRSWQRLLRLDRTTNSVELTDAWSLGNPSNRIEFNFMTPCPVSASPGRLALKTAAGAVVTLTHDPSLVFALDEIPIDDARLKPVWGSKLHRIRLTAEKAAAQGKASFRASKA